MGIDAKARFFDDDGTEINAELISKPSLCLSCKKDNDPREQAACNLNRMDQKVEDDFICEAYESIMR
jgi:hypothetical protein